VIVLTIALTALSTAASSSDSRVSTVAATPRMLQVDPDWDLLLPPNRGAERPEPRAPIHNYLGEDAPAATQRGSAAVNHLRSVGARPQHIFLLLILEAGFLALIGVLLGTVLSFGLLIGAQRFVIDHFGIVLTVTRLRATELEILAGIVLAALAMGAIPAWRAYRNSLADGLIIRV
jgi:hypothetical protein